MTQRDRTVLIVLGFAALLAGFWFGVLGPKRKEVKALDQQVTEQTTRRDEALAAVATGKQARENFGKDYAEVAKLGKAVPVTDQVPSLVYQIQSAADKTGVDFRVLKLRAGMGASAASAAASGVAANQAAAAVAPPGSSVGPAGFPTLPFTFKFEGEFFRMERMLSAVEQFTSTLGKTNGVTADGRLLTVDGFSIGASKLRHFPYISAAVTATAYVLPPGEGAFAGATPAGPATAGATGTAPATGTTGAGGTTTTTPPASTSAPRSTTASVSGVTP